MGREGTIEIEIPLPPSLNHSYFHRGGKRFLTPEANSFRSSVRALLLAASAIQIEDLIGIHLHVRRENFARDIDNVIKHTIDAMQGSAYKNDNRVAVMLITSEINKTNPGIGVRVFPVTAAEALTGRCMLDG